MTKAEKFIEDYSRGCSNELYFGEGIDKQYERWLTPDQALCAVEIEKEELIEKACDYWTKKGWEADNMEAGNYILKNIGDFIKFMEE